MRFGRRKQLEDAIMRDKSELISQFYPIKDGQLQLSFASCDVLIDQNLESGGIPRLRTEVFDAIDRALLNFKSDTITKLSIASPSDSSFTAEMFADVLHKNMRLRLLELVIESRKNRWLCLYLFTGGCLLLALSYLLGRAIASNVVFDVINILGSLLIWTAGENHFLEQAQNRRLRRKYALIIQGRAAE